MRDVSESTYRGDEACQLVSYTFINRRMLTTTRLLARYLRGEGRARPSGRLSLIAITLALLRLTKRRQRFWYTRRRTEKVVRGKTPPLAFIWRRARCASARNRSRSRTPGRERNPRRVWRILAALPGSVGSRVAYFPDPARKSRHR